MKPLLSGPWAILTVAAAAGVFAEEAPRTIGMEELHRLDLLPAFKTSVKVASISTYDHTGGNDDGFSGKYSFVRKEGDDLVLADLKGPGCLYRFHTPTPTNDLIEFSFDGEAEPRIKLPLRQMFTGQHEPFVEPICGHGAGGFYSYVPLTYKRSLKILLRAKSFQFYQLNYATYPENALVETLTPVHSAAYLAHRAKAAALFSQRGQDLFEFNLPPGTAVKRQRIEASLQPGQTATVFKTERPGRIAALRLGPADALAGKDRDILLRITWDGDDQPAVLCPAGDFFGYAWGKPATGSCLLGTANQANYCFLPMPFDRSAAIELISARREGPPVSVSGEVVTAELPRRPEEGKFYAVWHRENPTTKGKPFTFVDTQGRGHIVGLILQAQGHSTGTTGFFEGDDQTTIDGELAVIGIGSEDNFNGGWYDVVDRWDGALSLPLSGCLGYQKHLGRTGGYRFMIGDAYSFRKSVLQTIEHAPEGNTMITDYCGMTYLYCEPRPTVAFPMPDAAARRVVDFSKITFAAGWSLPIRGFCYQGGTLTKQGAKIDGRDVRFLSLRAEGHDFFGPPFVSITCDLPETARYVVHIEPVKGPQQGCVQLFQTEAPVGEPADLFAEQPTRSGPIRMGVISAAEGPNHLMFKIVGKNNASKAHGFDLVNIICERER
ncbi:MAG TPA: DUF2961 domain-containing protein [Phycisphaerae bacterium]|nr:DUF2961 domain-containing protein [Phycisphaerae bacterium]HRY69132.1 DUF2961 domain-containing protein [Phycisphaerae bacterium]HSA26093.1 DUF2961 domain-containing protein [Phycisphaerae bacterium]